MKQNGNKQIRNPFNVTQNPCWEEAIKVLPLNIYNANGMRSCEESAFEDNKYFKEWAGYSSKGSKSIRTLVTHKIPFKKGNGMVG